MRSYTKLNTSFRKMQTFIHFFLSAPKNIDTTNLVVLYLGKGGPFYDNPVEHSETKASLAFTAGAINKIGRLDKAKWEVQ